MIVQILIVLSLMGVGVFLAFKKIKKMDSKEKGEDDILLKEFNDGKILLPIDKKDFENFEEFKGQTLDIKSVNDKLKNIDNDYEKFDIKIKIKENELEVL